MTILVTGATGIVGRRVVAALAGVERVYLFPVAQTAAEVGALAAESGVRQIVDLPGTGADDETFEDGYQARRSGLCDGSQSGSIGTSPP